MKFQIFKKDILKFENPSSCVCKCSYDEGKCYIGKKKKKLSYKL